MTHKKMLAVYSTAHAIVDFSCAFLVYRAMMDSPNLAIALLFYTFCAFALQMPFGLVADGWNRNSIVAAVGCGIVAVAYLPFLSFITSGFSIIIAALIGAVVAALLFPIPCEDTTKEEVAE